MKILFIISTCFIFLNSIAQQLGVSESLLVGSSNGNYHPQIELNSMGEPMVLWTNPSNKAVYISKKSGQNFEAPIQLNPTNLLAQTYNWSGPDLAVENNNVYVVFRSDGYETGHIYLVKSNDNGNSFSDTMRVDFLTEGYAQYPDIAVLNDTIYTTYMAHDAMGMNPQYVLSRSFDGGLTFESQIVAGEILGDEACDCCQPELVVNDETVIILFRNNATNIRDIKAVVSYDRGANFSTVLDVDNHNWLIQSCPSTGPDAGINAQNKLFSVYKSIENSTGKVFLNASEAISGSSMATINLSEGIANGANYPQIAIENQTIGVVFEGIGTNTDVFFMYSFNEENGFDILNRMNLTNLTGIQNKPDIAILDGVFHVVYADNTDLKYLMVSNNVGIETVKKSVSSNSIVFSKQNGYYTAIKAEFIIDIQGNIFKFSEDLISNLSCGTYFLQGKNTIQKLIIIP